MKIKDIIYDFIMSKQSGQLVYKIFDSLRNCELPQFPLSLKQIEKIQKSYENVEMRLRNKSCNGEKINVAFLVTLSSMFPARPLLDELLKNEKFNCALIVIPDYRFNSEATLKKTVDDLMVYKSIMLVSTLKKDTDKIDLKKIADIVVPPFPYDISHRKYNLRNMIKKGILPIMVNYGYPRSYYDKYSIIASEEHSLCWRVFAESEYNYRECIEAQKIKGKNVILTGYCKMDGLANLTIPESKKNQKIVIIAPHHSVNGGSNPVLSLSNFERYAELFLKLPSIYPQIDFIFRPHPALFPCLRGEKFWGNNKVENYLSTLMSYPNVTFSSGGDYFSEFLRSDGIIHDCGSYLVEYFYTEKPQCYMLKDQPDIKDKFTELGQRCLDYCYIAYDEVAILKFIDDVILRGNDIIKKERSKFAKDVVMLNHPNVAKVIVNHLEKCLCHEDENESN